jgi:cytoplasmic iron level regulating protein YaaA (DUF328/UPF0246 family)
VLVLLPPSEGKTQPASGSPLNLASLSSPALTPTRDLILRTLVRMSQGNATLAAKRLGLGPTQLDEVARNAALPDAPTARADTVYTGVLYENWSPGTASASGRAHADETVAIASALFGVVRAGDHIPAYRLSAGVTLPRIGPIDARWRQPLGKAIAQLVGDGMLVDLRSGAYANLHKPTGDVATRTATVRVLTATNGVRKVVSHFNKATKGTIVRDLCEHRVDAASPEDLTAALADLGWSVERDGRRLDVVV